MRESIPRICVEIEPDPQDDVEVIKQEEESGPCGLTGHWRTEYYVAKERRNFVVTSSALSPYFSTLAETRPVYHYVSSRIEMEIVPIVVDNKKLYRIGEALATASLSRATYFRWLKAGRIRETQYKDRNGRRLFTETELETLVGEAKRLVEQPQIEMKFGEAEKH